MPLQKLQLKPGVNRENTRYTTEGGWWESDKIRFRQGTPEKIGGWERISANTFLGVCRSLWNWVTLGGQNLIGVGTNLKFYIERGGAYSDITPVRATVTLTNPFNTTNGSALVTVDDVAHGCVTGDFVTFSGATTVGSLDLNNEYEVTVTTDDEYTITASSNANATVTGGGTVTAAYQINTGANQAVPLTGWSAGAWGIGTWGNSGVTTTGIRLWSQSNFGEDLVFAYRGGPICYWDATNGVVTRGLVVNATNFPLQSDCPTIVNSVTVSDIFRFVVAFGANDLGTAVQDPMLIRWSDQEDFQNWTPAAVNQAGSLRLSSGSEIVASIQARQEILVCTDTALYSMQYLGAPEVWGAQLLGDNISIASQNSMAYAGAVAYWMGRDKFYMYDGTVRPLPCNVRKYVFTDINPTQYDQVCTGTNEGYHEVWWFYCSAASTTVDRYIIYNYLDNVWYYGNMARTAWLDSSLRGEPIAATYSNNLVNHEVGNDDKETAVTTAIHAYITSSEFDLDDGDKFMFINRMLPDVTFEGSSATSPAAVMTLLPMQNSGSGYNNPLSKGGVNDAAVTRTATVPIEEFTGQVFLRIRGRQMAFKVESTEIGVAWQLGTPRVEMRPDGRR